MSATHPLDPSFDLVVVGSTPSGITFAVRAARAGKRVYLATHTHYLGGILASGLGCWDTLYTGRRAPIVNEFVERVRDYYAERYGQTSPQLRDFEASLSPEPHVAEAVFTRMVEEEPTIEVARRHVPVAVQRAGTIIEGVTFRNLGDGSLVCVSAPVFADAAYEGDLLALTGTPYRVGRESRREFDEPHAGRIFTRYGDGRFPRAAAAGTLNLRPFELTSLEVFSGSTGEGDDKVQAYNFRSTWSRDPANQRPIERPPGYDRATYAPLLAPEAERQNTPQPFKSFVLKDIANFAFRNWKPMPNGKLNWNHGHLVGGSHGYPEGDWTERARIVEEHKRFDLGLWYFLQNDPAVPAGVQARAREWGLARDEFVDNDNFPYEIYVRETRRLAGKYVFSEHDASLAPGLQRAPIHRDSVAIAEWPMDSHECTTERQLGSAGEGAVLLSEKTRPSQIPYRCLLPVDLENLLVITCLSSTHLGWGTVRVEPTLMHVGEAAAIAAVRALDTDTRPSDLPIDELQDELVRRGVMITFFNDIDMASEPAMTQAAQVLGTLGCFSDYDVRPDDPLTRADVAAWTSRLQAPIDGGAPRTAARAASGPATSDDVRVALERIAGRPGTTFDGTDAPIARGAALPAFYAAWRRRGQSGG